MEPTTWEHLGDVVTRWRFAVYLLVALAAWAAGYLYLRDVLRRSAETTRAYVAGHVLIVLMALVAAGWLMEAAGFPVGER